MNTRRWLGRLFVGLSVVSVVGATGGWAAGAPETAPAAATDYERAAPRLPSEADLGRGADALQREKTRPERAADQRPRHHLLASIERGMRITARPGAGPTIGSMPAGSRFYGTPHRAWILERTNDGRWGKVAVPYSARRSTGWISLQGLELSRTPYSVEVDLSRHLITVNRFDKAIMRIPAATGAAVSPTPPGRYFVTDRAAFDAGGYLGSFAFGLSGIQPNLPPAWTGGDQLAIHGTNDPSSIGTSTSAGCLRVSERALDRLKPRLGLGTPVVVKA